MKRRRFTNKDDAFIDVNWGKMPVSAIAKQLNRTPGTIYSRAETLSLGSPRRKTKYVVYRGDENLGEGTADECAELAQVTRDFIYIASSERYKRQREGKKPHVDRITVIKLDEEETA